MTTFNYICIIPDDTATIIFHPGWKVFHDSRGMKTFAWKIKTFCYSPINHSLFSVLSSRGLFNEQIETMLNLCYQAWYLSRIVFCSMIGDGRKKIQLKYEPIQRSIMIIKSIFLLTTFSSHCGSRLITIQYNGLSLLQFVHLRYKHKRGNTKLHLRGGRLLNYIHISGLFASSDTWNVHFMHPLVYRRQWKLLNWAFWIKKHVCSISWWNWYVY